MEWHPVSSIFPMMLEPELQALADDIRKNGQLVPVIVDEQQRVIDGRNRAVACALLSIEPNVEVCREKDPEKLAALVWSLNESRRQLDKAQRDAAGVNRVEFIENAKAAGLKAKSEAGKKHGRGKTNSLVSHDTKLSKQDDSKRTTAKIAADANSSPASISRAQAVKQSAPDLFEKMERGQIKTGTAYNELRKRQKKESLEQKAAEVSFEAKQPTWTLINQDVYDGLQSVLDNHAKPRLIFADPPYNIGVDYGQGTKADKMPYADYLEWFGKWLTMCESLLSDDGTLWVLIGDEYAAEYVVALKRVGFHLRSWVKWYETFGVNCSQNFNRTSRHLLYCVKNRKRFVFHESTVTTESARQAKYNDKRAVEGGKILDDVWTDIPRLTGTCSERLPQFPTQLPVALLTRIVACCSEPGDLVVDPFNGSGTTGEACIRLNRKYVGIDASEEFIDLADLRLKGVPRDV